MGSKYRYQPISNHECFVLFRFGNFPVTLISQIFYFRIISEFLNSQVSVLIFYKAYGDYISENFARQPIREYL